MTDVEATRPAAVVDDALRVLLRDRDVACPHCGQNMRGGNPRRCAECGGFLVPTLSFSPAVLSQRNPHLVSREWMLRCLVFVPAAAHLSFALTLSIASVLTYRAGLAPAPVATMLFMFHAFTGALLGILGVFFLGYRRATRPAVRSGGFLSGVLLVALGFLSLLGTAFFRDRGWM